MSKRTSTRGYFVSWVIYVLILVWVWFAVHNTTSQGAGSPSPIALPLYLMLAASGIAMLVFWIGALIRLGRMGAWGWFVAVLLLSLVGMLAYAIAGPEDTVTVVMRPPTAT